MKDLTHEQLMVCAMRLKHDKANIANIATTPDQTDLIITLQDIYYYYSIHKEEIDLIVSEINKLRINMITEQIKRNKENITRLEDLLNRGNV